MPTVREKVEVQIDFEMWCETCGSGICSTTKYKKGSENHFTTYCPDCVKDAERKDKEIADLEADIARLESDAKDYQGRINDLESQVEELERETA